MDSSKFQFQFIHLNSIDSTNIYALELLRQKKSKEGTVVSTDFQEIGKGQRGELWESDRGKNLQFSVLIAPEVSVGNQFSLTQLVAVSLNEWLDTLAVEGVQIKWPNDILVRGRKIAGVLIENSIQGNEISHSVIGIGLNVNQNVFSTFSRPATSLSIELDGLFDCKKLLNQFLRVFKTNYLKFKPGQINLQQRYLGTLYGFGTPQRYKDCEGEFTGVILGVLPSGKLQINKKGKLKNYDLKDLKFLD